MYLFSFSFHRNAFYDRHWNIRSHASTISRYRVNPLSLAFHPLHSFIFIKFSRSSTNRRVDHDNDSNKYFRHALNIPLDRLTKFRSFVAGHVSLNKCFFFGALRDIFLNHPITRGNVTQTLRVGKYQLSGNHTSLQTYAKCKETCIVRELCYSNCDTKRTRLKDCRVSQWRKRYQQINVSKRRWKLTLEHKRYSISF